MQNVVEGTIIVIVIAALFGTVVGACFLAIPIILRTYRPDRYRGIWRIIGDIAPTTLARIAILILGSLIGVVIGVYLLVSVPGKLLNNPLLVVVINAGLLITFTLAFVIGIRRWKSKQ